MLTIECSDLGWRDEKGVAFHRTIVGKTGETKPTGFHEEIALREGDIYIEYGNNGTKAYMYNDTDVQWYEM